MNNVVTAMQNMLIHSIATNNIFPVNPKWFTSTNQALICFNKRCSCCNAKHVDPFNRQQTTFFPSTLSGITQLIKLWFVFLEVTNSSVINLIVIEDLYSH